MKYINSHYLIFDMASNMRALTKTINNEKYPNFGGGDAKININAETTKLYVAFDIQFDSTYSYMDGYAIQIYMDDGVYDKAISSTVQFYLKPSQNYATLDVNGKEYYKTGRWYTDTWYRVYLVIDSVAGTVDLYLNGDKIYTCADYVKTGVKAKSAKIMCKQYNGYYVTMKDVIISDLYFPPNEAIIEVPATVTADGWHYDSSKNLYSTETENATLTVIPDLSVLDGYKVTACNVGAGETVLGDAIKNLQLDMGTYSETREIPFTGKGKYWDGLPTNIKQFTVKAKKQ